MKASDLKLGEMIALDPSIASSGVALFRGGALSAVDTIKRKVTKDDIAARCLAMAEDIGDWIQRTGSRPRVLVCEWPAKSWRGDARDLHGLPGVNMGVAMLLRVVMLARQEPFTVLSYEPGEWSGGMSKTKTKKGAKFSPRAVRALSRLNDDELEAWHTTSSHDAIDAIGIGLYALGRLEARRLFPGAV